VRVPAIAILAVFSIGTWARDASPASPYAGEEQRALKAVSPKEAEDLTVGRGMGFSKVAELNHYPGPKHVLELAGTLQLTDAQVRSVTQVHAAMEQEAQRLGKQILEKETELETLFASRHVEDGQARALVVELGRLQGELRYVHIGAHLSTGRLLSAAQIASYDRLRGYAEGAAPVHRHHD
jgi:Spy/CpxP family protein refolding chaperone